MLFNKLRLKVLVQHLAYLSFCDSGLESLRACLTTCNLFSNRSITSLTAAKLEGSTQTQAGAAHLCLPKDHRARRARGTGVRRAWAQLFLLADKRPIHVFWQCYTGNASLAFQCCRQRFCLLPGRVLPGGQKASARMQKPCRTFFQGFGQQLP